MKAYSLDSCEHVTAACQQADRTIGEVAAQFSASDSFVRKFRNAAGLRLDAVAQAKACLR
ncbi:hypothetical protein [Hymenobacter arizonensis]|uniref:Uncharacterized protein n=1 Tax=Hymenobacter arizonensis TaxID=1227077 RepID=A0A1I6B4M1_HYMAR|nr:hypothetical protein [Hymenobacter arizonensis]SFQ75727.1 hypothetical protein SAMN04515668_4148 [Hymenobacter arizonensis]